MWEQDGEHILYSRFIENKGIWRAPVAGGSSRIARRLDGDLEDLYLQGLDIGRAGDQVAALYFSFPAHHHHNLVNLRALLKGTGGAQQKRLSAEWGEHFVHVAHPLAFPGGNDNRTNLIFFSIRHGQFEFSILALDFK